MKASLLQATPLSVAYVAGKACVAERISGEDVPPEKMEKFFKRLIARGHESVLEHVVLTFDLDGFSRATLQELARHRVASISVESTRWSVKHEVLEALNAVLILKTDLFDEQG